MGQCQIAHAATGAAAATVGAHGGSLLVRMTPAPPLPSEDSRCARPFRVSPGAYSSCVPLGAAADALVGSSLDVGNECGVSSSVGSVDLCSWCNARMTDPAVWPRCDWRCRCNCCAQSERMRRDAAITLLTLASWMFLLLAIAPQVHHSTAGRRSGYSCRFRRHQHGARGGVRL